MKTTPADTGAQRWTGTQKLALRFFLPFFSLYIFLNPNGSIPYTEGITDYYLQPFHQLIPWLAKHVLQFDKPVAVAVTGSGDTTYDYLSLLCTAITAGLVSLIWTMTGKSHRDYDKLFYWACVIVRFYLAFTMLNYGMAKVIKLQFPFPSLGRLVQPFGSASPMGLAWTYMGYSAGFNYFVGFGELICGILLLFRRTVLLGAILSLFVSLNIMAVNYCFDVPVKILSTMLVVMSLFLLVKDGARLVYFFFLSYPDPVEPGFSSGWKRRGSIAFKYILIIFVGVGFVVTCVEAMDKYGDAAGKPPLYGIYDVESFVRNGDTIPPLTTDTTRWRKLIVGAPGYARIMVMNDTMTRYAFDANAKMKTITGNKPESKVYNFNFVYTETKEGKLLLRGKWMQDSLHIRLKKFNTEHFILVNRGFHWANEYPFNK